MPDDLSMVPLKELPNERKTFSELPPPPPPFVWPIVRRAIATVLKIVLILGLSCGLYFFYTQYVISSVRVSGSSMFPTLVDGDYYLLNLWAGRRYAPQRGDIVVLRDPAYDGFAVKRVVGLGGESIFLKDGNVYVNNQKLSEPYLSRWVRTYPLDSVRTELFISGANQVFVLGDNRANSADSREYGPVPHANIRGVINR